MEERLAELESMVETLVGMARTFENAHRRNALYDRCERLARSLVTDRGARAGIAERARTHPDPLVRESFHFFLNPVPPQETGEALTAWLEHPALGLGHLAGTLPVRRCAVLPETRGIDDDAPHLSWLAGLPSTGGGPWPRDAEGRPLALVLQADLDPWSYGAGMVELAAGAGLPTAGVLQVFHDLWSENPGSLCVRHVAEPGERVDDRPEDYDLPVLPARPAMEDVALSVRSPLDAEGLGPEEAEQWEEVRQRLVDWHTWAVREEYGTPARPVTTILGSSWNGATESLRRLGAAHGDRDGWVLLADIPGVRHLEGWFGDEGHLEVWIRDADLRAGRFGQARPVLRQG